MKNTIINLMAAVTFIALTATVSFANAENTKQFMTDIEYAVICQDHCTSFKAEDYAHAIIDRIDTQPDILTADERQLAFGNGNKMSHAITLRLNSGDIDSMVWALEKINEVQRHLLGKPVTTAQ